MTLSSPKKILIMAGGTGGHVFPALAVAEELRSRDCDVQWLGTDRGIEARVVPERGILLNRLEITGIRGKGALALLIAPWKILLAIQAAKKILRQFQPNVVLGMGGYVSGPGGIAAWLLGVPLIIHEQNARPGTTNKWLARFAKRILTAFPNVLPNSECIGNPIRKEITELPQPSERLSARQGPLRVLVLGGSLGAKAINELLPQAIKALPSDMSVNVRHQTGEKHIEATTDLYKKLNLGDNIPLSVSPFIEDMAEALGWADLVICRSGALTVSELSAVGVASILIPFPFAIDDHQTANANWLVEQSAAKLQPQNTLTVEKLKDNIMEFVQTRVMVLDMAKAARQASKPGATSVCADFCLEFANG